MLDLLTVVGFSASLSLFPSHLRHWTFRLPPLLSHSDSPTLSHSLKLSTGQINLLHSDIENAVQSTWSGFINSIKIDADEWVQGQISNLYVQINEMKDWLCGAKKSEKTSEAALTKECS